MPKEESLTPLDWDLVLVGQGIASEWMNGKEVAGELSVKLAGKLYSRVPGKLFTGRLSHLRHTTTKTTRCVYVCTCVLACVFGAGRSPWLLGTGEATCASAAGHRGSCVCCRSQALENHAHGRSLPKNTRGPGRRTSFSYDVCLIPHWQSTLTQLGKEKYLKDPDTFL